MHFLYLRQQCYISDTVLKLDGISVTLQMQFLDVVEVQLHSRMSLNWILLSKDSATTL